MKRSPSILVTFLLSFLLFSHCSSKKEGQSASITPTQRPYIINNIRYIPIPSSAGYTDTGVASWYGRDFHGKSTSNGERYNMYSATAAHKLLPMNTMLHVRNLDNGRESVVRINDRGPFVQGRIIDLSYSSAKKLGIIKKGTARVRITALAPADRMRKPINLSEGEYYVQIGAFKEKNNALRLQRRFADAGHAAVIHSIMARNDKFHRVQVYVGTQLAHARRAERALLEKGYSGAFLVAR